MRGRRLRRSRSINVLGAEEQMKRTISFLIDWSAITAGGIVTYTATGSYWGMAAGMIVVAAYSMWCFIDGTSA